MADKQDQNLEAIAKLLVLTQQGKIDWDSIDSDVVQKKTIDGIISSVFLCSYKGKLLRLYIRKYKALAPNPSGMGLLSSFYNFNAGIKPEEDPGWFSEVVLELTDEFGNSVWQFPKEKILRDLLEAVKYKASGAHDLIQSLISDNCDM